MALPKDGIGKLAAAIVESAVETGRAGLIIVDRSGNSVTPYLNTESNQT